MNNLSENIYKSPSNVRKSLLPSFMFFLRLFKIIINKNGLAKKGEFNSAEFAKANWEILHALESVGVRYEVEGIDNVRNLDSPAVYIGNHMSSLETMTLASFIEPFRTVSFIMKKELLEYPLFGVITGARHPITVGRENPREDLMHVLNDGKKKLAEGRSIVIFPQRTRALFFEPSKFNTLGIKLAQRSNAFIVPLAIISDAWGNGKLVKDFGKIDTDKVVRISFGKAFKVENASESHKSVLAFIGSKFKEWGREDLIKE